MKPLYSIIILSYNRKDLTEQCLESINQSDYQGAQIIVVDNGSTDGSLEYLKSIEDKIDIVPLPGNIGVQGYNHAIPLVEGTYLVTLNNDVIVAGNWLDQLREPFLSDPKMALVGARSSPCFLNEAGHGGACDETGEADYVEGSCMMALTAIIRKYGLFDPEFRFAYCEDSDLSLRLRKRGYHIATVNAPVRHLHSQTVPVVEREGVDVWGCHDINHVKLRSKWGRYLKTKSFEEVILIRRTMALGDVLMTTPVIHALKQENAHAIIVVQTEYPEVFRDNPEVTATTKLPKESFKADRFIDLDQCYEKTPDRHVVDSYAEACGVSVEDYFPRIYPRPSDYDNIMVTLDTPYAVLHAGPHRGKEPVEGRTLTEELQSHIRTFLLSIGLRVVDISGVSMRLHILAALIGKATVFIGADSGPMHIAQAMHTPTVAIFGSVNPAYRMVPGVPYLHAITAWSRDCGCLGCHHAYEPPMLDSKCIRIGDNFNRCMKKVIPEDVFNAIDHVLRMKKMYLETSKIRDVVLPYLNGRGIDVGCQRDPITPDCVAFDKNPTPETTHIGDARQLPFLDKEFDWLWSSHCLEDIPDTQAALKEWLRVIKPGGVIGVYVPHPDLYKGYNADHAHPGFTLEELTEHLTVLGCQILRGMVHDDPRPTHPCHSTLVIARKPL